VSAASARPDPRAQGGGKVYRNFIGGEWVASESGRTTPNLNPADTREVLGLVPLSTADEARRAVDAATAGDTSNTSKTLLARLPRGATQGRFRRPRPAVCSEVTNQSGPRSPSDARNIASAVA